MTLIATGKDPLLERELTGSMIGGFYDVYSSLGYGFLEKNYTNALEIEFRERGFAVEREVAVHVSYKGHVVGRYRIDMVVEGKVIVEVKCGAALCPADHKQVSNYLKASRLPIALLFHFGPRAEFYRTIQTSDPKKSGF